MAQQKTIGNLISNHLQNMFRKDRLYTQTTMETDASPSLLRRLHDLVWPRKSLFMRHLDCGSCNGCELELLALQNPIYDMHHLGFEFKASPRHADALLMTGPFTRNLKEAAILTLEAMPEPKRIVTIGDCAKDGGIYQGSYALTERPPEIEVAIERHAPGCPPSPQQILDILTKL